MIHQFRFSKHFLMVVVGRGLGPAARFAASIHGRSKPLPYIGALHPRYIRAINRNMQKGANYGKS